MTTAAQPVPLESGDRMSREEFRRRYVLRTDIKKAEWIGGVVYVASPVRAWHAEPHSLMGGWLTYYRRKARLTRMFTEITLELPDADVQPDLCLVWYHTDNPVRLSEDNHLLSVPDLAIEIAASSASYDLHTKLALYERAGVPEYVVWTTYERRIRWFLLVDGRYQEQQPDERGVLHSVVFPGLRLPVTAMLEDDVDAICGELERGWASDLLT